MWFHIDAKGAGKCSLPVYPGGENRCGEQMFGQFRPYLIFLYGSNFLSVNAAEAASLEDLLEVQILRSHPDLQNQKLGDSCDLFMLKFENP